MGVQGIPERFYSMFNWVVSSFITVAKLLTAVSLILMVLATIDLGVGVARWLRVIKDRKNE